MVWTPATQPRDPLGRFRKTNLVPGEYTSTTRSGIVKKYYVNDMNQLADGSTILHMSAQGKVFSSFKTQNPIERIHIIGNSDMEQMAVAASGETTFGVDQPQQSRPTGLCSASTVDTISSRSVPISPTARPPSEDMPHRSAAVRTGKPYRHVERPEGRTSQPRGVRRP